MPCCFYKEHVSTKGLLIPLIENRSLIYLIMTTGIACRNYESKENYDYGGSGGGGDFPDT